MKKKTVLSVAAATLILAGCSTFKYTPPTPDKLPAFPAKEYSKLPKTGDSTVYGQVFMMTRGGNVKYGAGEQVMITPATTYSAPWALDLMSGKLTEGLGEESKPWQYSEQADGEGKFEIGGIPAGEYYIVSEVHWNAPGQYGLTTQGGHIVKHITIKSNSKQRVILSD